MKPAESTDRQSRRITADTLPDTPEALLSTTLADGAVVHPLYTRRDERPEPGLPGHAPFVRGADPARDVVMGWRVTERFGDTPGDDVVGALESGASGVWLRAREAADLALLDDVYLDLVPVTLDAREIAPVLAAEFARRVGDAPRSVATTASLGMSPLTAAFSGRPAPAEEDAVAAAVALGDAPVSAFRVDGTDFAQAGAPNAVELGFALAAAVAHLRDLEAAGVPRERAVRHITLAVSADDQQFPTIAKIRAARLLWARVTEVVGAAAAPLPVHAVTALEMASQRDPWVNLLRGTVAAFAAGVGGADQVTVLPFDEALPAAARTASPAFARRMARNTQLLLLEESGLGRVVDPAGGAWFVESLTTEIARLAWDVFTDVEQRGGYLAALADGAIERAVAGALADRERAVARRKKALTGVNEFPNAAETELPAGAADDVSSPTATPRLARTARPFERLRDRADELARATGTRPSVTLVPLGTVASHNARTTFAANLLAAGGITAVNPGPLEVPDIVAALDDAPRIAVLCGSDASYSTDGAAALAAVRAAGVDTVYLAGAAKAWPPDAETAPDGFLTVGIDAVAALTTILDRLESTSKEEAR